MGVTFITGIDTGIGKTYATGLAARYLRRRGETVITQKLVQTGCRDRSEDIVTHRSIMGTGYTDDDEKGLTCPYLFAFPASPHLAAGLEHAVIDLDVITRATEVLAGKYDQVLLEGAGGLCVPLNDNATLLDYLSVRKNPIVLVSSPRLGSINHTLMALELLKYRSLRVRGIVYNRHPNEKIEIAEDSKKIFMKYLAKFGYPSAVVDMPVFDLLNVPDIDFSCLF